MKITDRYMIKGFLRMFGLSLAAITFIYVVVDMFEKMSRFIALKVPGSKILLYYLYEIPVAVTRIIAPIAVLIAGIATVGTLSRNFELIAFKASGISLYRLFAPLIGVGILLSLSIFVMDEELSTRAAWHKRLLSEQIFHRRYEDIKRKRIYLMSEEGLFFKVDRLIPEKHTLVRLTVYKFEDGHIAARLDANRAEWCNKWYVYDGRLYDFDSEKFVQFASYQPNWYVTFGSFLFEAKFLEELRIPELRQYINKLRAGGEDTVDEEVELHTRIAFSLTGFIVLLIALPIAVNVRLSGFTWGFAFAFLMSFIYWGLTQTGKALGKAGLLSPALAAWLPNLVFMVIAAILLQVARK